LFKIKDIHRVKIEIEFIDGVNISQENIRPNKLNKMEEEELNILGDNLNNIDNKK
jgi:hypothetical protein